MSLPLYFPTILQNSNPNYALVDSSQLRGSAYVIGTLSDTGSIPSDKWNYGMIIYASSSAQHYGFFGPTTGSTDWNNSTYWKAFSTGSGGGTGAGFPYSGSAVITGSLLVSGSGITVTGSLNVYGGITGSLQGTASNAISASYASTASYYGGNVASASYAATSSYATNFTASNILVTGTLTAATIVVQTETASVVYSSGSNIFGNNLSNTQIFTGSISVTGSLTVNSSSVILTNQTGSMTVATASYYKETDPIFTSVSASLATTGSNNFNGNQTITGSLTVSGSHILIGTKSLTGSLSTSGSVTVIGTETITGSLNITGSTTQAGNNNLYGNTTLSGSIIISGSTTSPTTPSIKVYGDMETNGALKFMPVVKNIDTSISASYIYVSGSTNDLYFSQNGSGYANTTRLRWIEGNLYSGLLNGGLITTQSATVYQVASGSGIIVNLNASLTNNPFPTVQYLNWSNLSSSIAPLSASYDQTFIAINSSGQINSSGTPYYDGQIDTLIPLGIVLHQNHSTINGVKTQPSLAYGWKQRSNIFVTAFGPLKLSGHILAVSGSSTGSIIVTGGTSFADGANYQTDPNNPAYVTDNGTSVSKIYRYYQSGSGNNNWVYNTNNGAGYGTIDPTQYSNNGVLTAVPGGGANRQWSIQRVFWYPNSVTKAIVVYYGNATYTTQADAIANISIESFVEAPNTAANAIYVGALIVRNNANFTDNTSYSIVPGGLFRQVGGSGGGGSVITQRLDGLSDVNVIEGSGIDKYALVYDNSTAKWIASNNLGVSITGNAVTATTSSYAATASYVLNAVSSSYAGTASYIPAAGSNGQVQFNNSGAFGGSSTLTYSPTTTLTVAPVSTATANNQILAGLTINPTYSTGSYTGTVNAGISMGYNNLAFGSITGSPQNGSTGTIYFYNGAYNGSPVTSYISGYQITAQNSGLAFYCAQNGVATQTMTLSPAYGNYIYGGLNISGQLSISNNGILVGQGLGAINYGYMLDSNSIGMKLASSNQIQFVGVPGALLTMDADSGGKGNARFGTITTDDGLSKVQVYGYDSTATYSALKLSNSSSNELFRVFNNGNVSIGGNTTSSLFQIYQPTTGIGTMTLSSTTITGSGTQFTNTFKIGDTFTLSAVSYNISAIASDTSMTVSPSGTVASPTAYTLTGGARFNVYGNGNVSWGGNTGTIGGPSTNMWYDATNAALNIGTSTIQSTYKLQVSGSGKFTNGLTVSGSLTVTGSNTLIGTKTITGSVFITGSKTIIGTNTITGSLYVTGSTVLSGSLSVTQGITGSLQGTASYATTASYALNGGVTQIIAGTNVTISPTNGLGNVTINASGGGGGTTIISGSNTTGSFTNQSTWNFYHGLNYQSVIIQTYDTGNNQIVPQSITLTNANTASIVFPVNVSGYAIASIGGVGGGGTGAGFPYSGSAVITGSLTISGSTIITGSVQSQVTTLIITSNTASFNPLTGNFFTLQLVSGSNTYINPTGSILPGQTINMRLATTGSATVTFPSTVKQPAGASYVPTTTTGYDILSFVAFDTASLYLVNTKNLS
jgi:hypothetical protein